MMNTTRIDVKNAPNTTIAASSGFVATRLEELRATDSQFASSLPSKEVSEAKQKSDLGLAEIVAVTMEAYADRPALAERARELRTDPVSGRCTFRLLPTYDTVTYRRLWSQARALANLWHHDATRPLRGNDLMCVIAFAGMEFATVDLAAIHNGAVVVPLQTNAPMQHLLAIIKEVEPAWVATSLECLELTVDLVLQGHRPAGLLLFDYHGQIDDERELFEAALAKLEGAGMQELLVTLDDACARGAALPAAPLYAQPASDKRLCTIYYTSGSTGLPKGAMYPELMVKPTWRAISPIPMLYMHYMPMNHSFGRSGVFSTLGSGGTCYFTAKSDLSTLFDDIKTVRPTFMGIVPRICEMVYQKYQSAVKQKAGNGSEGHDLDAELVLEMRENVLGGRLLSCSFGSAPLAPDLREFMEKCLGYGMDDHYGATEISGVVRNRRIMRPPVIDYKLDDVPELGYFKTDKPHPRGELRIKTRNVMLGYYKREDVTAAVFDDDGYYKTGDIMAEVGPDQLVYVDRRNNVLKLAQGEFVAISRLEALYTNGHALIRQAYLYGTSDRSFLVGVFVPNEAVLASAGVHHDETSVKKALREAIAQVARVEQLNAYEVPRDFIVENEPFSTENGLLAGIGKYQRPKFKERYSARLEGLYEKIAASQAGELSNLRRDGKNAPILDTLRRAIQATLGVTDIDLSQPRSFIELGGDSLSALSCSMLLEEIFDVEIPASVINNPTGTLQKLEEFIRRARDGARKRATFTSVHGRGATEIRAADLTLEKFIEPELLARADAAAAPAASVACVLITGANGYLGRFLCLEWLERMAKTGGRVICIVRGRDQAGARQRVAAAFERGDPALQRHFVTLAASHLEVLAGDLSEPDLGLNTGDWQRLSESVDLIVHPAAFVNHVLPYPQLFGPNVVGTAELIRLAIAGRRKPINYVSTVAAAMIPGHLPLDEDKDVRVATPSRRLDGARYADGYAHSKWAGEVLLREAHDRFGLPVAVFRSDMILAHSRYQGQINVPDMFTRWLLSLIATGIAPRSFYSGDTAHAHYDGLPVDFTAEAIATLGSLAITGYRTYHVVNPHDDAVSMDTFVDWMIAAGYTVHRIESYEDWVTRFETALRALPEERRQQSSLPLLHQLRKPMPANAGATVSAARFRADVRAQGVGAERDIPHISAVFIEKYLNDLKFLKLI